MEFIPFLSLVCNIPDILALSPHSPPQLSSLLTNSHSSSPSHHHTTAKLVDHLQGLTIGNPPQALVIFLDIKSLEMGKDFQEAFVDALTRSSVAVLIASHDAIERMLTHDPAVEDNVMIEWLTSLYLLRKKRLYVMPIFIGQHAEVTGDSLGGKFDELFPVETLSELKAMPAATRSFAAAVATASKSSSGAKCTIVQMLPDDITADATVRKAVELLKIAGKWEDGDEIDPPSSAFGLKSFSVRTIVTAITKLNGQLASYQSSVSDLLFKTSDEIKKILAGLELGTTPFVDNNAAVGNNDGKSGGGSSTGGSFSVINSTAAAAAPSSGNPSSPAISGLDRAWAVLHTDAFVKPGLLPELQQFLVEEEFDKADDLSTLLSDRYKHLLEKMTTFLTKKGEREFKVAMDRTSL